MARTVDYYVRAVLKEDGVERDTHEARVEGTAVTRVLHQVIAINSNSSTQLRFGSNFNTAYRLMLQETAGRSFTYSVNQSTHHHAVRASGAAFLDGHSITALYFKNNSTNTTKPTIEVFLAG